MTSSAPQEHTEAEKALEIIWEKWGPSLMLITAFTVALIVIDYYIQKGNNNE